MCDLINGCLVGSSHVSNPKQHHTTNIDTSDRGNASNYLRGLIVEACTINVGFHPDFGTFRRSRDSKTSLRSAIINEISFNPTYDP